MIPKMIPSFDFGESQEGDGDVSMEGSNSCECDTLFFATILLTCAVPS